MEVIDHEHLVAQHGEMTEEVLVDEPTAQLDVRCEVEVYKASSRPSSGCTTKPGLGLHLDPANARRTYLSVGRVVELDDGNRFAAGEDKREGL
jgi:hypothetical protein